MRRKDSLRRFTCQRNFNLISCGQRQIFSRGFSRI